MPPRNSYGSIPLQQVGSTDSADASSVPSPPPPTLVDAVDKPGYGNAAAGGGVLRFGRVAISTRKIAAAVGAAIALTAVSYPLLHHHQGGGGYARFSPRGGGKDADDNLANRRSSTFLVAPHRDLGLKAVERKGGQAPGKIWGSSQVVGGDDDGEHGESGGRPLPTNVWYLVSESGPSLHSFR